jgi:hypothetical protein
MLTFSIPGVVSRIPPERRVLLTEDVHKLTRNDMASMD